LSTAGYQYIKPFLADKMSLHDTCGVNNLHGMPAILAAIVSIVTCAINDTPTTNGGSQTMAQVYSILCTLGLAIVSGSVTGMILRIPMIEHLTSFEYFEDGKYWEIEEEEEED
jgi:ammonium transporter Rh